MPILILRHRKERLSKCSLRGLEGNTAYQFFLYPDEIVPLFQTLGTRSQVTMLSPNGMPLSLIDAHRPLMLLDATWKLAAKMEASVWAEGAKAKVTVVPRSLPQNLRTAYPRRQTHCPVPASGLASAEALFAAQHILQLPKLALERYRWSAEFVRCNAQSFSLPHQIVGELI